MSPLRYLIYLRKSSESEERQELSIPAQARELAALAERRELRVMGTPLQESMSAREPGRPIFSEALTRIERGQADGLLCWKLDRLARNPVDGGRIMYALGKKVIKEIVTPERVYTGTSDDKMLMSINFGMATKFSDDLSDNVRRGNREALLSGRWPGKPKLGYQRDQGTRKLVPDPERFAAVLKLWQLFLGGRRPLDILRIAREDLALRTPVRGKVGGRLVSKAEIYRIFRSPFYAGIMVRKGETHPGSHEAMITMDEFDRAQALLDGRVRPLAKPQHRFFTFGGLMLCGRCGAAVTAKIATNRYGKNYTYYYCCRKERRYVYCPERAVQENEIERQFAAFCEKMLPPPRWLHALMERFSEMEKHDQTLDEASRRRLEEQLRTVDLALKRERDLVTRGVITEEDYLEDRARHVAERQRLEGGLSGGLKPPVLVEPHKRAAEALRNAKKMFVNGTPAEKRDLVTTLTWNLRLMDRKLLIQAQKAVCLLGTWSQFPTSSSWLCHVGTRAEWPRQDEEK